MPWLDRWPPVGGILKSQAKDLLELAICVYKDAVAKSTVDSPDLRDIETLTSRVEHEGVSFLTITLPTVGEDLEEGLGLGRIEPGHYRSFRKYRKGPAFLRALFAHVFDLDTGGILNEPCPAAIEGIRQIAYTFKKLKEPCTPYRVHKALQGYVESERDLERDLSPEDIEYFTNVRRVMWSGMLRTHITEDLATLRPKHGPGATAERIAGNRKYRFATWYDRLEPYFPLDSNALVNVNAMDDEGFKRLTVIDEDGELPVRVITVPKTLKKPRIIAIEPVCMQYAQQAISQELTSALERSPISAGHVNFTDQSINRRLAMDASKTGRMATLDLSAASDRVPLTLAMSMFEDRPDFQGAILACRTRRAELPDGTVMPLRKFASMGSALCFPIEAMYFYTICVGALLRLHNLPVTWRNAYKVSRHVYVYGDDIIVPNNAAVAVADDLQKYYCKVNITKSHWVGKFRESCGMDAYAGEEVTPTYVKHGFPSNRQSAHEFISLVASSNSFYKRGYWQTASLIVKRCEQVFGRMPILGPESEGIGLVSFQRYVSTKRWNRKIHRPEVKAWTAAPVYQVDKLGGYPALLKCLLALEARSSSDASQVNREHLSRTARHGAVALRRRWVSPM